VYLFPLEEVLRHILFFDFFDDVSHFDGIVKKGVSSCFFFLHDGIHGVFVEELEVLTFGVGDLLLADVLAFRVLATIGCLLPCQIFLIGLLLVDLVAPVVHPLHAVEMGTGDETSFYLNSL